MSLPRTVAEVLREHVTLDVEGIDRMYLNVYVPALQRAGGVASFFRFHLGHRFASSALMDSITKAFIARMEQFAQQEESTHRDFREKANARMTWRRSIGRSSPPRKGYGSSARRKRKRRCSAPSGGAMNRPERPIPGWYAPRPWSITSIYCMDRDFWPLLPEILHLLPL